MIRISTAVLIAVVALSVLILLLHDPKTAKEINGIADTPAAGVVSRQAKVDATRNQSFSSTERHSPMIPMTDNRRPIRPGSSPAPSIGQQPPSFVVLDASEPSERIDIGEFRDVEGDGAQDRLEPQNIGLPIDADDLGAYAAERVMRIPSNLGESRNADDLESIAVEESAVEPTEIGEPLNVDPLDDSLRQTAQRTGVEVQDSGPRLPVLDETTDPWTLNLQRIGD